MTRRKSTPTIKFETYVLEIIDWRPSYSFSTNESTSAIGPYREHLELELNTVLVIPSKSAGKLFRLQVLGDRGQVTDLQLPEKSKRYPPAVGAASSRAGKSDYLGAIPMDALWGLVSSLTGQKIKYVSLHGELMKWGKASIRSISFMSSFSHEDYE